MKYLLLIFHTFNQKNFQLRSLFDLNSLVLEITGLPENTENGNLEDLTLKVLNEIGVNVDSRNVEDCHWIKTQGPKKVIIKFSRRKDANKVRTEKKN